MVQAHAGASLKRDEVDNRLIGYLTNGYPNNITGIIDSQSEVGGFPTLKTYNIPTDTDQDGMDDEWEKRNNLKVGINDANGYNLSSQYTNLEVYAESLVSEKINSANNKVKDYDFIVAKDGSGQFKTIQELIKFISETKKSIIPTFHIKRIKTNYYYYCFCSPEALNEVVKYLQQEKDLNNDRKIY